MRRGTASWSEGRTGRGREVGRAGVGVAGDLGRGLVVGVGGAALRVGSLEGRRAVAHPVRLVVTVGHRRRGVSRVLLLHPLLLTRRLLQLLLRLEGGRRAERGRVAGSSLVGHAELLDELAVGGHRRDAKGEEGDANALGHQVSLRLLDEGRVEDLADARRAVDLIAYDK